MRVRTHTNPFNFFTRLEKLALSEIFKNPTQPLDFEIGFGRGLFLKQWAKHHPNRNIVGAEIRKNIVSMFQNEITAEAIPNIHLINGNGEIVLEDCFEDKSIENIFVFHPDPWFKKSHHKRRVIRPKFLEIAHKKLAQNGKIYISTDVTELWEAMVETIDNSSLFQPTIDETFWKESYNSDWNLLREKENRAFNFGVYKKKKHEQKVLT